jgi:hypothetical protein
MAAYSVLGDESAAVGRVVVEDGLARMEQDELVQRLHEKMLAQPASRSGRPRAKHILQHSKAELRSMGWRGETYFSRSQGGRSAPYIENMDSDSDYEYDDLTNVPENELADSWRGGHNLLLEVCY